MKVYNEAFDDDNIIYEHPQIEYHDLKMLVAKKNVGVSINQQAAIFKAYNAFGRTVYISTFILVIMCIVGFIMFAAVGHNIYGTMMCFFAFPLIPSLASMIPLKILLRKDEFGEIDEEEVPEILKKKFTAEKIIALCCVGIMTFMTLHYLGIINVNWVAVILFGMFAAVTAVEIGIMVSVAGERGKCRRCTEPVTARLIGLKLEYSRNSDAAGAGTYLAAHKIIEYDYYGETIRLIDEKSPQYTGNEPIGSEFEIFVNPEKPSEAVINRDGKPETNFKTMIFVMCFIGIFVVMLGGMFIYCLKSDNFGTVGSKTEYVTEGGKIILTDEQIEKNCRKNNMSDEEIADVVIYERVIASHEFSEDNRLILCFEDDFSREIGRGIQMLANEKPEKYPVGDTVYWVELSDNAMIYNTKDYVYKGKYVVKKVND